MEAPDQPRANVSILSFILLMMSIQLAVAMLFGRWFFGPGWFGTTKETAAYSMIVVLFVAHRLSRNKMAVASFDREAKAPPTVSGMEALIIVILVVAGGGFGTWLFVGN